MNITLKAICAILTAGAFCGLGGQIPLDPNPCWTYTETPNKTRGAALGDINGDGYLDLAVSREDGVNFIFINGNGILPNSPTYALADSAPNWGLAFGDYDNDGDLDLAVGSCALVGGRIRVYRNESGALNPVAAWTAPGHGALWVGWADIDGDGDLDLAAADLYQFPCAFRNNGGVLEDSPFWEASDYNVDLCGCWFDVDNDGDLDLAVGPSPAAYPMRLYLNDQGDLETNASWTAQAQNSSTGGLAAGDADRDGWLDLYQSTGAGGTISGPNYLYYNQGGTLESAPSWISADTTNSSGAQFADLNGDGYPEVASAGIDFITAYRNSGGTLVDHPEWISAVMGGMATTIAVGDIDRDGVLSRVDTIPADTLKKIYYLGRCPVHRIDSIKIDNALVPAADYCCILESGWFSLKNRPPQGSSIFVHYGYSGDLEAATCNYVFNNNLGTVEAGADPGPGRVRLEAAPNPFQIRTVIRRAGPDTGPATLRIYDAGGRAVRQLEFQAGNGSRVAWSGEDDSGRRLPPGIYFARIGGDDFAPGRKIVLVR